MPIRYAGPAMRNAYENMYPPNGGLMTLITYAVPASRNVIPPITSRFQDIQRMIERVSTGMLCINNPVSICQAFNPGSNTSSENKARKHINSMERILGVQYR